MPRSFGPVADGARRRSGSAAALRAGLVLFLLLALALPAFAAALSDFSAPSTVDGGTSITLSVTLDSAAPTGGASVSIATSDASAIPGGTIVVPQGQTSASGSFATSTVNFLTTV